MLNTSGKMSHTNEGCSYLMLLIKCGSGQKKGTVTFKLLRKWPRRGAAIYNAVKWGRRGRQFAFC